MRSVLLLAGILCCLAGTAQAAAYTTQQAGNAVISLPDDWKVFPRAIREEFSRRDGPEILLLAEGPADGFPELAVIRDARSLSTEAFRALDAEGIRDACAQLDRTLKGQLAGEKAVRTECARVEHNGVPALAERMVIPAAGSRPELVSMTWEFPNGREGVIANAMIPGKDTARFEDVVRAALASVRFTR